VVAGSLATGFAPGGCDAETRYHCARVVADPDRATGRTLVLDGLRHSYVDIDDPTYLRFAYVRAIASVVDTAFPEGEPLTAHHIGGGGLTFPRYLAAVRPGTRSLVSEIDPGVVRVDRERLGLGSPAATGIDVRVEDGRLGLRRLEEGSRDLVLGDAFGGVSVPWHLTTSQALADVRRALDADGLYVANLIDHGGLAFARAEVATLAAAFPHVALLGKAADIGLDPTASTVGGNLVVVASGRPVDAPAIQRALDARDVGWRIATGETLTAWTGDARVLTDDHAPVDQLLQTDRSPAAR
ncbi:spermidine synthase, partial [Streptomyces sp. SID10692]|uniref:fused MFS/spermidine synthase n=2 Tax=Streptomyces TaxID=1883 RepID=UPI001411410F|nr:spermidine synthase [Streptomyces sp. SID10692]